jgi:Putative adhesin
MRRSVLFSLFFALVLNAAQNSPPTTFRRDGSNWVSTEQGSLSVDPTGTIRIKAAGSIRVRGAGGSQITYKVTRSIRTPHESQARAMINRFPVSTARQGSAASLTVAYGPSATNLEITVPRSLESLSVATAGGDIDASDLNGALVAEASGGRINVGHVGGNIDIRAAGGTIVLGVIGGNARCLSGGGAINAMEIRGDALLETGGGDIHLRKAGGAVRASTAGGRIEVVEAKGTVQAHTFGGPIEIGSAKGVHCESASGSISAQFLPGIVDSFLSTGSGDITVWIPSNLRVSIRAQNEGSGNPGTVISDFPGLRVMPSGAAVMADLSINGGGPIVQLAGNGGRIYIKKR